jgi:hypothetical protein
MVKGILFLTLKDKPYNDFLENKHTEYRRDSDWICKRMFDRNGNRKIDRLVVRRGYKKIEGKDIVFNIISIKHNNITKEWEIKVDISSKRFITYPDDLL